MKPLLPLFLCIFCTSTLLAQKETNNWFYGNNSGHTFVNGNIQPLSGFTNSGFFISTSYSDANGNLKFIFTGARVLDRNYNIMPGSTLFPWGGTASHIVLAAASPANPNQFYLFYVTTSGPLFLKYAIVDMSLNGGLGQVISADNLVDNGISAAFTLVQKKGSNDFWIVTHVQNTDIFHSWLVSATGVSSTPVISQAGTNNNKTEYDFVDMKTSPNGEMIAGIAYKYYPVQFSYDVRFVEVFNVDRQSGIITNKVKSTRFGGVNQGPNFLEFSPDNRLLYTALSFYSSGLQPCGFAATHLYQFNLCYTDSVNFTRYAPRVLQTFSFCFLQYYGKTRLGPDKKIYMRYVPSTTLSAVDKPNIIGNRCDINSNVFTTADNGGNNLPDFYHAYTQKAVINNIVYTGGCYPNPLHFKITNDTINHVEWNFGDAASGGNNISTNKEEDHVFSSPGYYTVTANLYASNGPFIETVSTLVEIKDPTQRLLINYPQDTTICQSKAVIMKLNVVNGVFAWYTKSANGTWDFNTLSDSFTVTSSGNYMVEMVQNDCNGCRMRDSIKVTVLPSPTFSLGTDTYVCTGDSLRLSAYAPGADFLWNTNDITDHIYVKNAGQYWVTAEFNHNGCPMSDTINISQRPGFIFSLPNDTTLCNNQTLLLNPGVPNVGFYRWQNGSGNPTFQVTTPGKYWVYIYNNSGCTNSDTINVNYVNAQAVYLGADTSLCVGDSVKLIANVANVNYRWSTGATDQSVTVKHSGQYWVEANNSSCTVADTISVVFNPIPYFSLGNDTLICEMNKLLLDPGISNAAYLWQNGSTSTQFTATTAGLYWGQVTRAGCAYRDTLMLTTKPVPPLFIGNDTTICDDATLLLQAGNAQISQYKWQDNSSADRLLVHAQGTYWVLATGLNGCTKADTIQVYKRPLPVFTLGNDTTLCERQQLAYNFNLPSATYTWNTGNTSGQQTITQPGLYWLQVSQQGCAKRDSISLLYKPVPQVTLGNDTTICEGISYQLNAITNNPVTYSWQNNSTGASYVVQSAGTYWVRVLLNGCANADTVNIAYKLKPVFDLGGDTMICKGQPFILQPRVEGSVTYQWQNGSTAPTFNVTGPGTYAVTVTNECGEKNDRITITEGLCLLIMPNAFSPNRDGVNEVFRIKHPWYIKQFHMVVYNRWGEKVFESADPYRGWDGTFNATAQPTGAYVWAITLTDKDGQKDSKRGVVILTR